MSTHTAEHSPGDIERALRREVLGEVSFDAVTRGMHATDASHYQVMPACVVAPRGEAECIAAVRIAAEHHMPITARGGGTSLAGQTFGPGMILDTSRYMDAVLDVDLEQRTARVQPGVVRDQLNQQLAHHRLHFAPDPATSSRCTVGGMIGNNSSGMRSIVYGKTIDHVIALKVLLADGTILDCQPCDTDAWSDRSAGPGREAEIYRGVGEIIRAHHEEIARRYPKVMRRVSGYNLDAFPGGGATPAKNGPPWSLAHLVVGSEGTLGLVLEATIRLTPLPGATALVVVHFGDVIESLRRVPEMLAHHPSTIDLLDDTVIPEARRSASTSIMCDFFEGEPAAVQLVEFQADTPEEAQARAEAFAADMRSKGIGYAHVIRTMPQQIANVWEVRKLGAGLGTNITGPTKPIDFVDDAAVPVEHLADYIDRLVTFCRGLDVPVSLIGHSSVGVLHPKPMLDMHKEEDRRKMQMIADAAFEMVREYGGSWCGEHGDGLVRGQFIKRFFGDGLYDAFRQVKALFDPVGLMNPGKIIDTPTMHEHMRYGTPAYARRIAEVNSRAHYHYRGQQGFALAVEHCNGVGACRKLGAGTMCPSYMATRDEEASTRGRANALRLAMSGQLGDDALAGDRIQEVLSLCLSCKACKSECPNAVDMARLKSDVTQMHFDRHGVPLGARLLAGIPDTARRLSGPVAPLVNAVNHLPPVKWLTEKITGVDRRRTLPAFARHSLVSMLKRRAPRNGNNRRKVALFIDTFTNYFEPHVGIAAVELLENLGYTVVPAEAGCCQRPRLSGGLVREAKRLGAPTMANLDAYAAQGLPILVLEPSCASALADDLPDLIDDEALAARVAPHIHLIDNFLADELEAGRLNGGVTSPFADILIHGHCHQKALFGTGAIRQLLAGADGVTIHEIDAGCCGMAGSFGYTHHDLSMKIGEDRLFPAIRNRNPDACIVADGFSCRHQIRDACGVAAKHVVEVIRAAT